MYRIYKSFPIITRRYVFLRSLPLVSSISFQPSNIIYSSFTSSSNSNNNEITIDTQIQSLHSYGRNESLKAQRQTHTPCKTHKTNYNSNQNQHQKSKIISNKTKAKNPNSKLTSVDIFKSPIIYTGKYCLRTALENISVNVNRKVALIIAPTKPNEIIIELHRLGYYCQIYTEFDKLPKQKCIENGKDIFKNIKPGLLLAVGGKNSMDVAKLILLSLEYPNVYQHYLNDNILNVNLKKTQITFPEVQFNRLCPLVFISGQLSCGTEMKTYAELYVGKENKIPIAVNTCDPDVVIQDSLCIPHFAEEYFIPEAFYLLVQAIEAYVSPKSSNRIKIMAKHAAKILYDNMSQYAIGKNNEEYAVSAAKFNDTTIRVSADIGTCVSNASSGITTAMSVVCNGYFNIPEELSSSVFLSDVIEYNLSNSTSEKQKQIKKGYNELAEYLGLEAYKDKRNIAYHFIHEIQNLQHALDLPTSIKDLKHINIMEYKDAIPYLARTTANLGQLYGNTSTPKHGEIEKLFFKAL